LTIRRDVMKKAVCICVVLALIAGSAAAGYCQDPARKLGRGIANIITCPVEIPNNIVNRWRCDKAIFESLVVGLPTGILRMVMRCGVGAFETVTFLFPLPSGYCPVMEPEFVWDGTGDDNASNFNFL
jgi:putative exosortase-associated protein (TIGR04073 family)